MIGPIVIVFEMTGPAGQTYRTQRVISVDEQRNGAPLDVLAAGEARKFLASVCGDYVEPSTGKPRSA